jgi:Cu2+-exporting ATPase
VALGIAVTFVASSAAALQGAAHGSDGIWFDSVTMFVAFLLIGRWLEAAARERALAGVGDLMARLPQTVERLDADGHSATVAPRALLPGDRVRLAVGQAVPADGTVLDGHSHADESMLTGESRPVVKQPGDALVAGSLNLHAPLTMLVRKAVQHSRLQEIVDLMDAASARKPRLAQLADRFAGPFLIAVLVLAGAAFVAWLFIDASRAVWVAASVLVVACPCALSLATPTALLAASGQLARNGLLARSPQAIEALARADTFVFDKTGTLTSDRMSVSRTVLTPQAQAFGLDAARALSLAAALEGSSLHPVAGAIRIAAQTQTSSAWNSASDARLPEPSDPTGSPYVVSNPELAAATWTLTDLQEHPGAGLSARVLLHDRWHDIRLGSAAFAGRLEGPEGWQARVVLALDGQPVAGFEISETLRPDALTLVRALQSAGVGTEILSGDTQDRVQAVAERLGIIEARSAASPQDKLARIVALTQSGRRVAMVGDGINDAPVLAQAEVSVAFATGAALAQHHADLLILGEGLGGLAQARTLAQRTLRVVAQNLAFAAAYNALCIPLALAGLLPPWLAGIGMAGSSLVVVVNALRLAPRASVTAQREPSVTVPSPAMT